MLFSFACYMQQMGPSGKLIININNILLIEQEDTDSMQQTRYDIYLLNFPLVRTEHVHTVLYGIFFVSFI